MFFFLKLIMLKILRQTIFVPIDHKVPSLKVMFDQLAVYNECRTKDPMDKRSQASFYRVDKTSRTDLTGWTKDLILIFHPGQNIPCLFVNLDKRFHSVKGPQFSTRTNVIIDQRSFGLIRPNFPS